MSRRVPIERNAAFIVGMIGVAACAMASPNGDAQPREMHMAQNSDSSSSAQSPAGADPAQIPATELRTWLPESAGEWRRESYTIPATSGIRLARTSVIGTYKQRGSQQARLTITDMGSLAGVAECFRVHHLPVTAERCNRGVPQGRLEVGGAR